MILPRDTLIVVGGSTASGKSALALALARRLGGVIVNADSQQLFRDLAILTARPNARETEMVPHRLYGELGPEEQPSVGRWLDLAGDVLAAERNSGGPAIIVGGTGLYLHALLHGIPEMPAIPAQLREELRDWALGRSAAAIHERLAALDQGMAARLRPSDTQRLLRALEVRLATGRSLSQWQGAERRRLAQPDRIVGVALVPAADIVAPRIDARLEAMLADGALAEVAGLLRRRPDALSLPIAKVHGIRELAAVLRGALPIDQARAEITAQIRRYAKRQRTWFRRQLPELQPIALVGETDEALRAVTSLLGTR
ncbi:MAG: tRNA (adenosine(37)-N6)-dimethylallyltransferase MiaA [Geminicoccaceae bacterium]